MLFLGRRSTKGKKTGERMATIWSLHGQRDASRSFSLSGEVHKLFEHFARLVAILIDFVLISNRTNCANWMTNNKN